jgi:hypothetical protein
MYRGGLGVELEGEQLSRERVGLASGRSDGRVAARRGGTPETTVDTDLTCPSAPARGTAGPVDRQLLLQASSVGAMLVGSPATR